MSTKTTKIPKSIKFEDALIELEQIVQKLEAGDQTLEQSLQQFERGIGLARFCQQSLSEAEHKIKILQSDGDNETLQPFEAEP